MKIIHLSDLHLGYDRCSTNFERLTGKLITNCLPAQDYIIIITGDIVENANKKEYVKLAVSLLNRLKTAGFKLLVVPGNHDYGSGIFANFRNVSQFKKNFFNTNKISYPKVDIVDNIAFIGLDSNADELHWYDRVLCEGELGKKQRKNLLKILSSDVIKNKKVVIYLHHHPFNFKLGMQLKDRKKFEEILVSFSNIEALLFGHYHANSNIAGVDFNGKWGIKRCYNAGSSTHKKNDNGIIRIFDLNTDPDVVEYLDY